MDMKSFARGRKKDEKKTADAVGREDLEKTVEELGKKSESELMSELMNEVERGRSDGSFSNEALSEFMGKVAPMLTPEQQKRMQEITSQLKL